MAEELKGPSFYSYNLTVESPIDIDTQIYTLEPEDYPLLLGIGGEGVPLIPREPSSQTQFSWMEEEVPLPRSVLGAAMADAVGTTVTLSAGEAVKFRVGDGIRIDGEVMLVTDLDTTAETLTVTRGSASGTGTTATTHALGAEVIGIGTVLIEGSIGSANFFGRDKYFNYHQIFSGKINVSRTAQVTKKYGIPSELLHQLVANQKAQNLGIEQAMMYGVRHVVTATQRRQMGGLDFFITSNVNTTDTWLTVEAIQTMQQRTWDAGGAFDTIVARPQAYGALNNITGREGIQTVTVDDSRRGRQKALTVNTEFGTVTLARSRWVKRTDAFALKRRGNISLKQLRPMQTEPLAKTDDTDTWMQVCEVGLKLKGQDHMAKWTGLNTAAAKPGEGLV